MKALVLLLILAAFGCVSSEKKEDTQGAPFYTTSLMRDGYYEGFFHKEENRLVVCRQADKINALGSGKLHVLFNDGLKPQDVHSCYRQSCTDKKSKNCKIEGNRQVYKTYYERFSKFASKK